MPVFQLGFAAATDADLRRYERPAAEELAIVFSAEDGAPAGSRDLVVWPRGTDTPVYRISECNEHVDAMTYPLLFPDGMPGWHDNLQHHPGFQTARYTRLTPAQFYAHRLMVRDWEAALPHGAGQLFQQYVLDAYCRMETMRLNWCRMHQEQLRTETDAGLQEYVAGAEARAIVNLSGDRLCSSDLPTDAAPC